MHITFYLQTNTTYSTSRTTFKYPTTSRPKESGLGTGEIAGIAIGVVFGCIVICIAIVHAYRRYRRAQPAQDRPVVNLAPVVPPPRPRQNPAPRSAFKPPRPAAVLSALHCVKPLCKTYLTELNLNKFYFNSSHDKCFCTKCHDPSDKSLICPRWCKPRHGWVCFGLQLNQAQMGQNDVFKEWKTSHYGTSSNRLASILNNRAIPFDSDKILDGTVFRSGHPDKTHCTTSPSLNCASQTKFASLSNFTAHDGTNYTVQVVLLCKQKPGTYTITGNPTTFNTIEWKTIARGSLLPYGLMIRLNKQRI